MTLNIRRLAGGAALAVLALVALAFGSIAIILALDAVDSLVLATLMMCGLLLLAGAIGLIAVHVADLVRNPLDELHDALARIADGHLHERVTPQGPVEVRQLAHDVNEIATRLAMREQQLRHAVATDTIDAILAGISHEINTPLSYLTINQTLIGRGAVRLADRPDVPDDVRVWAKKARAWSDRSLTGLDRLGIITAALREVLRDDGDQRDLNLIVRATVGITHHRFRGDIEVTEDLAATQQVRVDGSVFFHALHGLLVDITSRHMNAKRLDISTRDAGDTVVLRIRYDGAEPPAELLRSLADADAGPATAFVPLHQVRAALATQGGSLSCASGDGDGTIWTLALPAGGPAAPGPKTAAAFPSPAHPHPGIVATTKP